MAHTNATANYSLPQFIGTDKPGWLTDINTAFYDIDAAMKDNADAADAATILDEFFPVGSEYVTSTNVQPSIGGTWILTEKELSSDNRPLTTPADYVAAQGITLSNVAYRRTANELEITVSVSNGTFGEDTTNILTLNPAALGVTQFGVTGTNITAFMDSNNVLCVFQLGEDGLLKCQDAWRFTSSGLVHTWTGSLNAFSIVISVPSEHMLDAACDRFIWKRVS